MEYLVELIKSRQPIEQIIKYLDDNNFDSDELNRLFSESQTMLFYKPILIFACIYYQEAVPCLVKAGAGMDIQDDEGWTGLMHSYWNNSFEAFKFLITSGANLNIRDNAGWTILMYVCEDKPSLTSYLFKVYIKQNLQVCDIFDNESQYSSQHHNIFSGEYLLIQNKYIQKQISEQKTRSKKKFLINAFLVENYIF